MQKPSFRNFIFIFIFIMIIYPCLTLEYTLH